MWSCGPLTSSDVTPRRLAGKPEREQDGHSGEADGLPEGDVEPGGDLTGVACEGTFEDHGEDRGAE
jgi:hypothetical protein